MIAGDYGYNPNTQQGVIEVVNLALDSAARSLDGCAT
jgi:hypothetical protein